MSFDTRDATMERACELALVVLDDLGAQYTRDGGGQAEALLEELIWYREAHRKTTVFTSNLPLKLLAERLGDRVADRLRGWGMLHELPGKSLRAPRRRT
jgi:DNA replication protein DnaC